jgi:hypothetical protein
MATAKKRLLGTAMLVLMTLSLFELTPIPVVSGNTTFGGAIPVDRTIGIDRSPSATLANDGSIWLTWMSDGFNNFTGGYDIIYKTYSGGLWSSAINITKAGTMNTAPSIIQLGNGTMLLFWAANTTAPSCAPACSLFYARFVPAGNFWTKPVRLSNGNFNDSSASAAVGRDGTLWLAWTRTTTNCTVSPCNVSKQLLYRTLRGNSWSSETPLTSATDANWNWDPSLVVSNDGRVRLAWSKGLPSLVSFQLYYKTYNGTVWSQDAPLFSTPTGFSETMPSIMQDRNGTIWIFWNREIALSSTLFQDVIMSVFSYNNGATWSSMTQITNDSSLIPVQDTDPAAVQGSDKFIWVFYATNLPNDWDIYARKSVGQISPVHSLIVNSITANSTLDYPGWYRMAGLSPVVTVKVTVSNIGDYAGEGFTLQVNAVNRTTYVVGSTTTLIGPVGGTLVLTYNWDTTGDKPALYSYSVILTPTNPETPGNMPLNTLFVKNAIRILPMGDIDKDGWVSIVDAGIFFYNFNFTCATPSRYNPLADPDNDCVIGIVDVGIVEIQFGLVT